MSRLRGRGKFGAPSRQPTILDKQKKDNPWGEGVHALVYEGTQCEGVVDDVVNAGSEMKMVWATF